MQELPPSLRQRSDVDSIREDIAPYLTTTPEERDRIMSQLCRWAADVINTSADPAKAWAWEDKRSPESLKLWMRLVAEARNR